MSIKKRDCTLRLKVVNASSGWPRTNIKLLDEIASLICHFYLSVAACEIVLVGPDSAAG